MRNVKRTMSWLSKGQSKKCIAKKIKQVQSMIAESTATNSTLADYKNALFLLNQGYKKALEEDQQMGFDFGLSVEQPPSRARGMKVSADERDCNYSTYRGIMQSLK